jgi:hypothetical protein
MGEAKSVEKTVAKSEETKVVENWAVSLEHL